MNTFDNKESSVRGRIGRLISAKNLPQTMIIEGGEGTSRSALALFTAMSLVCESKGIGGACGNCSSCKKAEAERHPDIKYIAPEEGKTFISVDKAREIKSDAYMLPFEADCKIYIAENADKLGPQAQNALLKLIEEPPEGVYFIFCAVTAKQLLQTVRSRAICFSAGKLASGDTADYLKSVYPKASPAFLSKAARLYGVCDDFDPESMSEDVLTTAFGFCDSYFSGQGIDYAFFKKKSASGNVSKMIFNLLAIGARDVYMSRLAKSEGEEYLPTVLSEETPFTAGMTVARALELYELFSESAQRLAEYANLNSVLAKTAALA